MGHGQLVRSLVLLGRSWVRRRPVLSGACRLVASAVAPPTVTVATVSLAATAVAIAAATATAVTTSALALAASSATVASAAELASVRRAGTDAAACVARRDDSRLLRRYRIDGRRR